MFIVKLGSSGKIAASQLSVDRLTVSVNRWLMTEFIICIRVIGRRYCIHFIISCCNSFSSVNSVADFAPSIRLFTHSDSFIHSLTCFIITKSRYQNHFFFFCCCCQHPSLCPVIRAEITAATFARCDLQMAAVTLLLLISLRFPTLQLSPPCSVI